MTPYHRLPKSYLARAITTHRSRFAKALLLGLLTAASSANADDRLPEVQGALAVCKDGPSAAVARALRRGGEAGVVAANILPNPELAVQHQRSFSGTEEHETVLGLGVSIGVGGRRSLLQDAARVRNDAALADAQASLFDQALAYRSAYAEVAIAQARVAVLAAQQKALEELTSKIQGLAKGGEAAAFDARRLGAEARVHRHALASAQAVLAASRAQLETWEGAVDVPAGAPLATLCGGPLLLATAKDPTAEHPLVRAQMASARASSLEGDAARRRWVPDLEVFAGYRATAAAGADTGHGVSVGLTVPLTFFDHGQGDAARAEAEQQLADATAEGLRRRHAAEREAAARRLAVLEASAIDAERTVVEVETLEAEALTLYGAGELSISELLDAYRASEEVRLDAIQVAAEVASARLSLMRARGSFPEPSLDALCSKAGG